MRITLKSRKTQYLVTYQISGDQISDPYFEDVSG